MRTSQIAAALTAAIAATTAAATAGEIGNVEQGLAYARAHCAECHGVEVARDDFSPNMNAPDFSEVANTPGMTERALVVWLQTSHPTMPDLIIAPADRDNVVAYIMSLKIAPSP